ncbi:NRDE family protein [Aquirhabdus sp.]|uniref:NRDE family protein n=1 Tax=Aquirhabdus sp. TaxID=2824160 RepID=UPI00396C797A
MCIVALAWQVLPNKPLVLIGNRDEFYARDASPLNRWPDHTIIAGQDLQSGGTWLGISPTGRWAVITNYREKVSSPEHVVSRGGLITEYLKSDQTPLAFLASVDQAVYAGFNLIVGTLTEAAVLGNRGTPPQPLTSGIHGLSNALLDTVWPKTARLLEGFKSLDLHNDDDLLVDQGLALLNDQTPAPDEQLPHTGVGPMMEKVLSPIRIESPIYGTRVSSVLILSSDGYTFAEKTLRPVEGNFVRLDGTWNQV